MLNANANLFRIKVREVDGRIFIPRHVSPLQYVITDRLDDFIQIQNSHESVLLACLKRPFFIEEVFGLENGKAFGRAVDRCLVKRGSGNVPRISAMRRLGLEETHYTAFFYVPVQSLTGINLGYCEIRNVDFLFAAARLAFPDVRLVQDL